MPTTSEALFVLYPTAVPLVDYTVSDDGAGEVITTWNAALGPQPTPEELAAVTDAHVDAAKTDVLRADAQTLTDDPRAGAKSNRAFAFVALDQVNRVFDRLTQQDAAIAAATSLQDLKSRWAALASALPMPERTPAQLQAAVNQKIASGAADA